MIIKVALLKKNIEVFDVEVTEKNYLIVKKKLQSVINQIIKRLKKYKKEGKIKSIYVPRDIQMVKTRWIDGVDKSYVQKSKKTDFQLELNKLVQTKKELKNSVSKINTMYK